MRLEIEQNVHSLGYVEDNVSEVSSIPGVDASRLFRQGVSAAQSGERELARTLLSRVTETDPRNADAWLWLASISEYPEELLGFLNNVLEIDPENARAREWKTATKALLAKTFVQRGINAHSDDQTSFAMECFETAIEQDSECEIAWVWKASLAENENQRVECLERVLGINPENEDATEALRSIRHGRMQAKLAAARSAAVEGAHKECEVILNEILESDPQSVEALTLLSQVVLSLGEKLAVYRRICEIEPGNEFGIAGHKWLADMLGDEGSVDARDGVGAPVTTEDLDPDHETESARPDNVLDFRSNGEELENELNLVSDPEVQASYVGTFESADTDEPSGIETSPAETGDHVIFAEIFEAEEAHIPQPAEEIPVEFETVDSEQVHFDDSEGDLAVDLGSPAQDLDGSPWMASVPDAEVDNDLAGIFDTKPYAENTNEDQWEAGAVSIGSAEEAPGVHRSSEPCPYCGSGNDAQAFECSSCRAVLTLSDIESVLANGNADREPIQQSITQMEAEWNLREFSEKELTTLGIGHLNLRNYDSGFAYLQEASRLDPNNVILAGQVNAIAIRLDEIRRQIEDHEGMPTGKNILVVDDSATVRKLISSKLEKSGHNVVCAEDGVVAMEMMENMVPDLVLLDITMPRMDGYSVCKLIRSNESTKNVPVVMISGKDGFFDKVRGRMAGTTGYVTKPFGPETLMRALETYLLPEDEQAVVSE